MEKENQELFKSWAIIELMGHRRLAGLVCEELRFGIVLLRIDIPMNDGLTTQYYHPNSIYCLTPTTEEVARAVAKRNTPTPIYTFEIPKTKQIQSQPDQDDDDDDDNNEGPVF